MIECCSTKRMLFAILLLGVLTFIVLIYESQWAFESSSNSHFGNYSLQKNASGDLCKNEESSIVEPCHPCSDFEITSKTNKVCLPTHFKEQIKCLKSGKVFYQSCDKVEWLDEKKFWVFELFVFLIALISTPCVFLRQKILDHRHLRNHQRRKDLNLKLLLNGLNYKIINDVQPPASFCALPAFNLDDRISCVAGFCTVLRQIVKCGGEKWTSLLGFRQACLVACAEVSVWTKFCEVDLISAAEKTLNENLTELPLELARLECHLKQPIRVHNVRKYKSQEHKYVEGPNFLLTDILAAIPTYIIMEKLNIWDDTLPLIKNWILNVIDKHDFKKELDSLIFDRNDPKIWTIPTVPNESLYKRDPTRYKPRHKIFTQQSDIDKSMEIISGIDLFEYLEPLGSDIVLNDDIPKPDVPKDRSERKLQQLINLVKSTLKVSSDGDIIVDFCSGSGHLGLILAHCLPKSTVVLLDNKETSLARAKEKLVSLNIINIYIVQANLDYYIGKFQVGVSLHACGVATDLVIQKCIKSQANFVVCPCCYGGIQKNHILNYPQSNEYKNVGLDERGYIVLGHCADQGSEQGERGMKAVDTDRCLLARNKGYEVSLSKLIPPSCTTRNNMIVATFSQ